MPKEVPAIEIGVSTEKVVHEMLKMIARNIYADHGIVVEAVEFEWVDVEDSHNLGAPPEIVLRGITVKTYTREEV